MPRSDAAGWIRSAGLLVALVAGLGVLFVGGEYLQRLLNYREARRQSGRDAPSLFEPFEDLVRNRIHAAPNPAGHSRLELSGLPIRELRIEPSEMQELRRVSELVSAAEVSYGIERDYVDARFLMAGDWVDVEVKPRGVYRFHYAPERRSLRVKFPRNRPFLGRRQTNILNVYDKGLTSDVTTNWELGRHGILTWHAEFVILKINDEVVGLFQEIEQFSRALTDTQDRTEGYIFGGSEGETPPYRVFGRPGGFAWEQARRAAELFWSCQEASDAAPDSGPCDWDYASRFLDVDKFAWSLAMSTLLGSEHAWAPDNIRVYFDPARGTLEPIPWDYLLFEIEENAAHPGDTAVLAGAALLRLPPMRRERDRRLWTLVTERVEPMIEHANEVFGPLEPLLAADNQNPWPWDRAKHRRVYDDVLRANAEQLREALEDAELAVRAWPVIGGELRFEIENRAAAHVEVEALLVAVPDRSESRRRVLAQPLLVDGQWRDVPGKGIGRLRAPEGTRLVGLVARNAVSGESVPVEAISLQTAAGPRPRDPVASRPASTAWPPGVAADADGRLVFGPGPVRLETTLSLDEGTAVELAPGLDLRLADGASLIVRGDLTARGTETQPVTIGGAGASPGWGAIVVQGRRLRPARVLLEHVTLVGGTGVPTERTVFTGALSVTDATVVLRDCSFLGGAAIDGINLKYSIVEIESCLVRGSADDSIDLDFCRGEVRDCLVEQSGGDGIDASGSDLTLERNTVLGCADKGFSIGERTKARLEANVVRNCRQGIAVKDESDVLVNGMEVADVEIGISLYRKKLTYGAPRARLRDFEVARAETFSLVSGDAVLELDSEADQDRR
jgi:hypothetical protein